MPERTSRSRSSHLPSIWFYAQLANAGVVTAISQSASSSARSSVAVKSTVAAPRSRVARAVVDVVATGSLKATPTTGTLESATRESAGESAGKTRIGKHLTGQATWETTTGDVSPGNATIGEATIGELSLGLRWHYSESSDQGETGDQRKKGLAKHFKGSCYYSLLVCCSFPIRFSSRTRGLRVLARLQKKKFKEIRTTDISSAHPNPRAGSRSSLLPRRHSSHPEPPPRH